MVPSGATGIKIVRRMDRQAGGRAGVRAKKDAACNDAASVAYPIIFCLMEICKVLLWSDRVKIEKKSSTFLQSHSQQGIAKHVVWS